MARTRSSAHPLALWLDLVPVLVYALAGLLSNVLAHQISLPSSIPAVRFFAGVLALVVVLEGAAHLLGRARRKRPRHLRAVVRTLLVPLSAIAGLLSNYAANALSAPAGVSRTTWHWIVLLAFLALVVLLIVVPLATDWLETRGRQSTPDDQKFLQQLARRYDAYLDDPLQRAVRAVLGAEEMPATLWHPTRVIEPAGAVGIGSHDKHALADAEGIHPPSTPEVTLIPPEGSLREIYETAKGQLLILGEPGAGKSTQLHELGRDLVRGAKDDDRPLLPVLLDLSSWAEDQDTLERWLAKEIVKAYDVRSDIATRWVSEQRVAPLLDALDVMAVPDRPRCVEAINTYHAAHLAQPLVVCCRRDEYERLGKQLQLQQAVTLQPLSNTAIDQALASGGQQEAPLRQAVAANDQLRDALRTPLILSLVVLTYSDLRSQEMLPPYDQKGWRDLLFSRYVDRMLGDDRGRILGHRPGAEEVSITFDEQTFRRTLTWLGSAMRTHHEATFYLEQLQVDWLPKALQHDPQVQAKLSVLIGLYVGVVGGVLSGLVGWLTGGLVRGLHIGLICGLGCGITGWVASMVKSVWDGVPLPIFQEPVATLPQRHYRVFSWLDSRHQKIQERVATFQQFKWSWSRLALGLLQGLVNGLIYGLLAGLFFGPASRLVIGLSAGLINWAIYVLIHDVQDVNVLDLRRPNEGVQRSMQSAVVGMLVFGLVGAFIFGLLGILVLGLAGAGVWAFGILAMLALGLTFMGEQIGPSFGANAVLRHYILRWILQASGVVPRHLVRFLDEASTLVLLRQVGGGYQFIHQLLRDYFADQYVPPK